MLEEKRVVFSTQYVEDITKRLDDGFQITRVENPYFMNIRGVRRDNLTFRMTKEELDHYIKCKLDVKYFANHFCRVKVEDGTYQLIKLRDYQLDIIDMYKNNQFSILNAARQIGKCNDLITRVLVYDTSYNTLMEIPLYELYFKYKKNKTIYDEIKYRLYRWIDSLSN